MEKFVDKISSYEIFNNLYPGIVFNYLLLWIFGINLIQGNILEELFMYYFLGMIISRIGSLIVEPICKKLKLVEFSPYGEYIKAEKRDAKLEKLSESNNTYRTLFTIAFLLLCVNIVFYLKNKLGRIIDSKLLLCTLLILAMLVLFAFAYRKQTKYIRERVEKVNAKEDKDENINGSRDGNI